MRKNKSRQSKKNIRLGKDIVASKADSLNKKLYKILEHEVTELTMDFINVKSVDPVGLSVIAATHNSINSSGAKLLLKNVPDEINTILDAIGLNKHFEIKQPKQNQKV